MQTKTNVLVFSLAAILSLSVVAMGEIPQAIADKDDDHNDQKKLKFKKKADFVADCGPTMNTPTGVDWDCKASFWLDKKGENLKYKIQIQNMDLTTWQTIDTAADDVGKVHLHTDDDGHVLNVWKAPIEDDEQLKVIPSKGILKGIYDDSDVTSAEDAAAGGIGHHDVSKPLTENIDDLCNGNFFVMIHEDPSLGGKGVLKGYAEPTKQGEKLCNKLGY